MDADEVLLALHPGGQPGDGHGGGVGAEDGVGLDDVLDLLEHLVLEFLVLEDGLDHEVHALEVGGVGGRMDPAQQRVGLLLGGASALERLGLQLLRVALALLRGLEGDVLEDDVEPGLGRHVGDTGAHHARAQHADLGDRGLADALRSGAAGVDGLQVEEERLDHVLRDVAGGQFGEVAALDAAGGVEVHLRTLDRGGQDGPRGRHVRALDLLAQQRRERRQDGRQRRAGRGSAGHLVALGVPRLGVLVRVGLDPRLGGRDEFLDAADEFVDQADVLGLLRIEPGALGQDVDEGVLDAHHPHGAGHAAAAGQQAQADLRQADGAALDVRGDAVVARQGDLQSAAEGRAVDGRDDRLAQGLQLAQVGLDVLDLGERLTGVLRGDRDDALEVTAGEEGLLGAGDDDTGDRILLRLKPFDGLVHGFLVVLVHHVGPTGGVVEGQGDDAVGILVPLNSVLCHGFSLTPLDPRLRRAR